jgi:uncharacterized protein
MSTVARHSWRIASPRRLAPRAPPVAPLWNYGDIAKAIVAVVVATVIASEIAVTLASSFLESGQNIEEKTAPFAMVAIELFILGAAVWFGPRKYRLSLAALGLRRGDTSWWLPPAMGFGALILVYGYIGTLSLIGIEMAARAPNAVLENAGPFIVIVVGAVFLAPVVEEVFFRGFIFGALSPRMGWVPAASVSGLLFAGAHLSILVLPPFAALGFLFAWAYRYTGSIQSSVIAHAIFNAVMVGVGLASSGPI